MNNFNIWYPNITSQNLTIHQFLQHVEILETNVHKTISTQTLPILTQSIYLSAKLVKLKIHQQPHHTLHFPFYFFPGKTHINVILNKDYRDKM